jgi:biotin carboxyl carrier protein
VRYHVTLEPGQGKNPIVVDVDELPSGALAVHVDGVRVEVDVVPAGAQLSVRIDGQMVDLATSGSLPDLRVTASGQHARVHIESEPERVANAVKKETSGKSEKFILSPMPGRVVKVFVQKGDVVKAGQPLLVIEAMKMENEVRAFSAGTIADVHTVTGAAVESNARLVSLV